MELLVDAMLIITDPDAEGPNRPDIRNKFVPQERLVQQLIIEKLADFSEKICPSGNRNVSRGNRHVMDTVIAATVPKGSENQAIFRRLVNVTRRRVAQAEVLLGKFDEQDSDDWSLNPDPLTRVDKYSTLCGQMVADWLHEIATENNEDKRGVSCQTGTTEDGKTVYEIHSKKVLPISKTKLPQLFRDSAAYGPWLKEAKKTIKNPKVTYNTTIKPNLCKCLLGRFHSVECACRHCESVKQNISNYNLAMQTHHANGIKNGVNCTCADTDQPLWTSSVHEMTEQLQCPKLTRSEVSYPNVDPTTGRIDWSGAWVTLKLPPRDCSTGNCTVCGFRSIYTESVQTGSAETGDEGVAWGCPCHGLESDTRAHMRHFVNVPNGSSVDADGKIKLNTRRDFVLSSLGTKDAVAMMQQFCRKHVEHVWRVKKTSFFIARFDFLHFDAMAVFDDACDAALFGHSQTPPPPPPMCYMSGCPNRVSERWKPRVPCASAACTREQQSSRCQSIADYGDVDSVVDLLFEELVAEAADVQLPLPPPPPPRCYMARCPNREKMSMRQCSSATCNQRYERAALVPPPRAFDGGKQIADYASAVPVDTGVHETAGMATICNHLVLAQKHSPKLVATSSLKEGTAPKKHRQKNGVAAVVDVTTDYFSVFSKAKHGKNNQAGCSRIINHFMKHGTVQPGFNCAMFVDGKLVEGSLNFDDKAVQDDFENDQDFYPDPPPDQPEMQYHEGPVRLTDSGAGLTNQTRVTDNCSAHFKTDGTFYETQLSADEDRGGADTWWIHFEPYHGKNETDAKNKTVPAEVHAAVRAKKPLQSGAWALTKHLAFGRGMKLHGGYGNVNKIPKRGQRRHTRKEIYVYVPATGFPAEFGDSCHPETKVVGSRSQRFFAPIGEQSERRLYHAEDLCFCNQCAIGNFKGCVSSVSGEPGRETQLRPRSEPAGTRGAGFFSSGEQRLTFWNGIKKGDVIGVRLHASDAHSDDENFFVAKMQRAAWKLDKAGLHGSNHFERGWWVVKFKWFDYVRTDSHGDFLYRYESKMKPITYQCNALIQTSVKYLNEKGAFKYDPKLKLYRLKCGTVARMERYCDLTA